MTAVVIIKQLVREIETIVTPFTIVMRPCLNELQKEYCVKIKLKALD